MRTRVLVSAAPTRDISPDGFTIIGAGINPSGNQEAWHAVIPEPSGSWVLMFAGLARRRALRQQ